MSDVGIQPVKTGSAARGVASLLNLVGGIAGVWGIVYPSPYAVCLSLLLALPVVAFLVSVMTRGRWALNDAPPDGLVPRRVRLGGMAVLPALALGMRALFDDYLLDASWSLAVAAGIAIAATVIIATVERPLTFGRTIAVSILCYAWAWGGLVWLNDALDAGAPQVVPAQVLATTVLTPKTTAFNLYLSAWGPYPDGHGVEVSSGLLRKTHAGDTVCVYIRPGRFGWRHFTVGDCLL